MVLILLIINQLVYLKGLNIMYFQFYNYLYISILFIHEFIKFYQYYPVFRKYYIENQQYIAFIKV